MSRREGTSARLTLPVQVGADPGGSGSRRGRGSREGRREARGRLSPRLRTPAGATNDGRRLRVVGLQPHEVRLCLLPVL